MVLVSSIGSVVARGGIFAKLTLGDLWDGVTSAKACPPPLGARARSQPKLCPSAATYMNDAFNFGVERYCLGLFCFLLSCLVFLFVFVLHASNVRYCGLSQEDFADLGRCFDDAGRDIITQM